MNSKAEIIVVSGLPRSGTSLMMQMLERGGIDIVADCERAADVDNPRGYYEFEAVKNLRDDATWIPMARGKAIKVVSLLLYNLPPAEQYRIIFMERNLDEVLVSQETMLQRRNQTAAPKEQIAEAYRVHLENLTDWLASQPNVSILKTGYAALIEQPRIQSQRIAEFLARPLNIEAMSEAIDPTLYRQRKRVAH